MNHQRGAGGGINSPNRNGPQGQGQGLGPGNIHVNTNVNTNARGSPMKRHPNLSSNQPIRMMNAPPRPAPPTTVASAEITRDRPSDHYQTQKSSSFELIDTTHLLSPSPPPPSSSSSDHSRLQLNLQPESSFPSSSLLENTSSGNQQGSNRSGNPSHQPRLPYLQSINKLSQNSSLPTPSPSQHAKVIKSDSAPSQISLLPKSNHPSPSSSSSSIPYSSIPHPPSSSPHPSSSIPHPPSSIPHPSSSIPLPPSSKIHSPQSSDRGNSFRGMQGTDPSAGRNIPGSTSNLPSSNDSSKEQGLPPSNPQGGSSRAVSGKYITRVVSSVPGSYSTSNNKMETFCVTTDSEDETEDLPAPEENEEDDEEDFEKEKTSPKKFNVVLKSSFITVDEEDDEEEDEYDFYDEEDLSNAHPDPMKPSTASYQFQTPPPARPVPPIPSPSGNRLAASLPESDSPTYSDEEPSRRFGVAKIGVPDDVQNCRISLVREESFTTSKVINDPRKLLKQGNSFSDNKDAASYSISPLADADHPNNDDIVSQIMQIRSAHSKRNSTPIVSSHSLHDPSLLSLNTSTTPTTPTTAIPSPSNPSGVPFLPDSPSFNFQITYYEPRKQPRIVCYFFLLPISSISPFPFLSLLPYLISLPLSFSLPLSLFPLPSFIPPLLLPLLFPYSLSYSHYFLFLLYSSLSSSSPVFFIFLL